MPGANVLGSSCETIKREVTFVFLTILHTEVTVVPSLTLFYLLSLQMLRSE